MSSHLLVPSDAHPRAAKVYDALEPHFDALVADDAFEEAMGSTDLRSVVANFQAMRDRMVEYNSFHQEERRMWGAVLRGRTPADRLGAQEQRFKQMIPRGRETYTQLFGTADATTQLLQDGGFEQVLSTHLSPFTATLGTPSHPYAEVFFNHFRQAGCDQAMLDEFTNSFGKANFDFFGAVHGGLADVRDASKRGVDAQLEILDYTEAHGFSYLRGRCGPPTWAIVASEILAAAGISISAWVIVAIIAALLVTLAVICALSAPGTWVRDKCALLTLLLPIFAF